MKNNVLVLCFILLFMSCEDSLTSKEASINNDDSEVELKSSAALGWAIPLGIKGPYRIKSRTTTKFSIILSEYEKYLLNYRLTNKIPFKYSWSVRAWWANGNSKIVHQQKTFNHGKTINMYAKYKGVVKYTVSVRMTEKTHNSWSALKHPYTGKQLHWFKTFKAND